MSVPNGILVSAESISGDGEEQFYAEVVVTLEEGVIDVRLNDRKGTIWMLDLAKVQETLRQLKRWERSRQAEA